MPRGRALVVMEASQIIFPSFLLSNLLNLLTCLLFTLLNLSSLTFSTNIWHFLKMEVDKIDASFNLHNSVLFGIVVKDTIDGLLFLPVVIVFLLF